MFWELIAANRRKSFLLFAGMATLLVLLGYFIGAALMIAGGLVEAIFGVKAERQPLEHLATPSGFVGRCG